MIGREEGRRGRKRAKEKSPLYMCIYWDPV